jgi:D-alanyl-D-alanine carboxypeptidase (penicillin-binding protein 5/6)
MKELEQTRKIRQPESDSRKIVAVGLMIFVVTLICYALFAISRKLPSEISVSLPKQSVQSTNFAWPASGSAAIGLVEANGSVSCRVNGSDVVRPTASVAKIITALVLSRKITDENSVITLNESDVLIYNQIVAAGGSNLLVHAGEKLTFREILEGILIVSADNLADSMANKIFGDFAKYKSAAEDFLRENGLTATTIGTDASGLDAGTVSTPSDLCKLTALALKNPLIAEIMGESSKTISTGQSLVNTNKTLGTNGILMGKTGHTDSAGYNLVVAAKTGDQTVVSVVLGQSSYSAVFGGTETLVANAGKNIISRKISAGQVVGFAKNSAGEQIELVAKTDLAAETFADEKADFQVKIDGGKSEIAAGETVGEIVDAKSGHSVDIVARTKLAEPNFTWKLIHPFAK